MIRLAKVLIDGVTVVVDLLRTEPDYIPPDPGNFADTFEETF